MNANNNINYIHEMASFYNNNQPNAGKNEVYQWLRGSLINGTASEVEEAASAILLAQPVIPQNSIKRYRFNDQYQSKTETLLKYVFEKNFDRSKFSVLRAAEHVDPSVKNNYPRWKHLLFGKIPSTMAFVLKVLCLVPMIVIPYYFAKGIYYGHQALSNLIYLKLLPRLLSLPFLNVTTAGNVIRRAIEIVASKYTPLVILAISAASIIFALARLHPGVRNLANRIGLNNFNIVVPSFFYVYVVQRFLLASSLVTVTIKGTWTYLDNVAKSTEDEKEKAQKDKALEVWMRVTLQRLNIKELRKTEQVVESVDEPMELLA